ncbi:hypothetical protein ACJX0J_018141, partial [Zea mays]
FITNITLKFTRNKKDYNEVRIIIVIRCRERLVILELPVFSQRIQERETFVQNDRK